MGEQIRYWIAFFILLGCIPIWFIVYVLGIAFFTAKHSFEKAESDLSDLGMDI